MDIKHEVEIKDEPLDGLEYDGTNDQICRMSGLQEISNGSCDPDIDFKNEIKMQEESGLHDFQNILEEDYEEEGYVLERKSSLDSGHEEIGRGMKDIGTNNWKEFSCSNCYFTSQSEDDFRQCWEPFLLDLCPPGVYFFWGSASNYIHTFNNCFYLLLFREAPKTGV